MIGIILYTPDMMIWLWLGAAVAGMTVYGAHMRRRDLLRFARQTILERLGGHRSVRREGVRAACAIAAALLIVLALCRPAWHARAVGVTHSGRDIVFVLDVSRSMFARDLHPNRLERAKRAIMDCSEGFTGDRVGLVVFAGTAAIKCPLTRDYDFFRTVLRDISWDGVRLGGTRIGDAIRTTAEHLLYDQRSGYLDIVLITDGEDHDSRPEEAAALLTTGGIRLIAVGIGDSYQGQRIQVEEDQRGSTTFLQYQGQEVLTRLNAPLLRRIVDAAGQSVFIEAGTGVIDLAGIYRREIATAQRITATPQTLLVYEEKFQWFLGGALALLLLRWATAFWRSLAVKGLVVALACGLVTHSARAGQTDGLRAYNEGRFAEAVTNFRERLARDPSPEAGYNLGVSLYKHGDYQEAFDVFDVATAEAGPVLALRCVYNQGNCLFRQAEAMTKRGPDGLTMEKKELIEMLALYTRSSRCFRTVLKTKKVSQKKIVGPSPSEKAAFNLELVKLRMGEAAAALKSVEEEQQMVSRQLVSTRKALTALIRTQEQLADDTANVIDWQTAYDIARLLTRQQLTLTETDKVHAVMEQIREKLPNKPVETAQKEISDAPAIQTSLEQVAGAIRAEGAAVKDLTEKRLAQANDSQYLAVDALTLALEAFAEIGTPEALQEKTGESEWTGRIGEGEGRDEGQVFELAASDIDQSDLPAPDLSAETILSQEVMNRRERQRKHSDTYGNVERNW